jgi:hypothetical protein
MPSQVYELEDNVTNRNPSLTRTKFVMYENLAAFVCEGETIETLAGFSKEMARERLKKFISQGKIDPKEKAALTLQINGCGLPDSSKIKLLPVL